MYLPKMGATSVFAPATGPSPATAPLGQSPPVVYSSPTASVSTGTSGNTYSAAQIAYWGSAPGVMPVSVATAPVVPYSGPGGGYVAAPTPTVTAGTVASGSAQPPLLSAPGMVTPNQVFGPSVQSVDSGSVPDLSQTAVTPVQTPTLSDNSNNWLLWLLAGVAGFLILKRA